MPASSTAEDILRHKPDGVFLSNGPGDPAATGAYAVPAIQGVLESGTPVDYRVVSAGDLAAERPAAFDLVTCMEMLEHVPDPAAILGALALLVKPGGDIVVSTLNRSARAFAVAIVGAEYIARVLPRGTHDYSKFIRPSELARWGRGAGLVLQDVTGLSYHPMTRAFSLSADPGVNYLAHFRRPDAT